MLNSRSRRLTITLAAGALTLFGATGALAAGDAGPGGGGDGGNNPLCGPSTPIATLPLCAQPPGDNPGGGGTAQNTEGNDQGGDSGLPGNQDGGDPLCAGTLVGTPLCNAVSYTHLTLPTNREV